MTFSRRHIVKVASTLFLPILTSYQSKVSAQGTLDSGAIAVAEVDDWMQRYLLELPNSKPLSGALDLRRFRDPMYVLLSNISWTALPDQKLPNVIVPRGFVTDFASIPRVFWSLFRPDGNYAYAAVIHDYLYWTQSVPRSSADAIFRSALDDLRIKDWQAATLFQAVALFGESAWNENAALQAKGERRILRQLPEDPSITWSEWKKVSNAF